MPFQLNPTESRRLQIALCVTLLLLACGKQSAHKQITASSPRPNERVAPEARLIVNPTLSLNAPLEFRWRISNLGNEPIYVYSSLLKEPFGADVDIHPETKSIDVRFTRLQPIPVAPNYFPATQFIKIDAGQSQEGTYTSHGPSKNLITYESAGSRVTEHRLAAGAWDIRCLIAYGNEIDSIKPATNANEHPINPVVRWQRTAYSNTERIVLQ